MSDTRFPPPGMKCVDCGCCQANLFAGDDPLCWACDAGSHAPKTEKPASPTTVVKISPPREEISAREEKRVDVAIPPAVQKAEPAKPATPLPTEGKKMIRKRVSDDVRRAIQNEPESQTNRELEKKYDLSSATISVIRRGLTIHTPRPAPIAVSGPVVISGDISPAAAEKFWSVLSVEQKQQIVKASIFSILNPAQEA